ncbi:MAG: NADH-quinone oxidoreductase subunit B [Actinomycetes bacterium]
MQTPATKPHILELGLACCALEASSVDLLEAAASLVDVTQLEKFSSHILVIAGTVTHALAPTVKHAYEQLAEPKVVIAFGVCAISGGPYWDSYSVLNGAGQLLPVDLMVPGCPPAPEDLAAALGEALRLIKP